VIDHDARDALENTGRALPPDPRGARAMRRGGETLDVGEQRADLTPFAIELDQVRLFDDASDDRRREMLFEPTPAGQRVGGADRHHEHQHGSNGGGQRIDEAIREPQHGDRGDPQKRDRGRA